MKNTFFFKVILALFLITSCSDDDNNVQVIPPSQGGILDPEIGGFNQPNRVYIDLSTGNETVINRGTWEIAVYNGQENRVYLNNALLVSVAELEGITDITTVTENTNLVTPLTLNTLDQTFSPTTVTINTVAELINGLPITYDQYGDLTSGISFTDSKDGNINSTAFGTISTTDSNNNVFIIHLGNEIPTTNNGAINTTGESRGFMKVRVLSDGNSYTIQYAELSNTSSFSEITVNKDSNYNLTPISLTNGQIVTGEPMSSNWDIDFGGVFSFYGFQGPIAAGLTFSDYTTHNTLGGVGLYEISIEEGDTTTPNYTDFTFANISESSFNYSDRAVIGSGWRSVNFMTSEVSVRENRYYIIKDSDNNYYKLRFTAVTNEAGERGFPQIQYQLLEEE